MSFHPPAKRQSLSELEAGAVNPRVVAALREVSRRLTAAGIRHATIGALAVGVFGWPRATADVDLLLGPEAWERSADGSATLRVPLPEVIDGVAVDYLPIEVAGDFLLEAFSAAWITEGVPVAPLEVVVLTKLIRLAMRDQADVVELVKSGLVDVASVETYLDTHAPMLTGRFRALVEQAARERARGS